MMFGDLFPDLKEETPAISGLEFEYDPRPAYDRGNSTQGIRDAIDQANTEEGVPENLYNLIITHAQGEEGSLKKFCFELGNKVYEHFRTPENTWKAALAQIKLALNDALQDERILQEKMIQRL